MRVHPHRPTRDRRHGGRAARRAGLAALVGVLVLGLGAGAAAAHEEGESTQASALVQQAQALLVNGNSADAVTEKLQDALKAADPSGTDLDVVRTVTGQVAQGPLSERRRTQLAAQLQGALTQDAAAPMATGAQTGTRVVLAELKPARGISDGGDGLLFALSAAAIVAGTALAYRWRPAAAPVNDSGSRR